MGDLEDYRIVTRSGLCRGLVYLLPAQQELRVRLPLGLYAARERQLKPAEFATFLRKRRWLIVPVVRSWFRDEAPR